MTTSSDFPEYVAQNVERWTQANAEYTDARAALSWARDEMAWGIWGIPESEVRVLPDLQGLEVVELGCGTAYCSAWFAKRGARPVGVDPTPAQLATARRMQEETGIEFPLIEAVGEDVPLPDASFDVVFSEYGASIWADPYKWIPEAARLLRPGGQLIFLCNSVISVLCMALEGETETLQRPQRGMHRIEWPDTKEVEFHISHSDWIDLLQQSGFAVERLVELFAPDDAETHEYYGYVNATWGRQWPAEEMWSARKRG